MGTSNSRAHEQFLDDGKSSRLVNDCKSFRLSWKAGYIRGQVEVLFLFNYDHKDPPHLWIVIDSWTTKNNVSILTTWSTSHHVYLVSVLNATLAIYFSNTVYPSYYDTLDSMTQTSPSTKHSSVDLPPYYDYNIHNTTLFRPNLSYSKGHYAHKWWVPHIFQVPYVTSTLKHVGESWGLLQALGNLRGMLWALENLRRSYEHISSIQTFFHTCVSSLCVQNDIYIDAGHFLIKPRWNDIWDQNVI